MKFPPSLLPCGTKSSPLEGPQQQPREGLSKATLQVGKLVRSEQKDPSPWLHLFPHLSHSNDTPRLSHDSSQEAGGSVVVAVPWKASHSLPSCLCLCLCPWAPHCLVLP